jgi:hypothetical protein
LAAHHLLEHSARENPPAAQLHELTTARYFDTFDLGSSEDKWSLFNLRIGALPAQTSYPVKELECPVEVILRWHEFDGDVDGVISGGGRPDICDENPASLVKHSAW